MRAAAVAVGIMVLGLCGVLAAQILAPSSQPVPPPPALPPSLVGQMPAPSPVPMSLLAQALNELPNPPPQTGWKTTQQPWTAAMVGQVSALVKMRERSEEVTREWEEGRSLIWTPPGSTGSYVALSVARFSSTRGAQSYFTFALELQRQRDKQLATGCVGTIRLLESRPCGVHLGGVEEAQCFAKRLQIGSQPAFTLTSLLLRQKQQVLELQWHGLAPDLTWVQRVVDQLDPGRKNAAVGVVQPPPIR